MKESFDTSYMDQWRKGYDALPELRWTVPAPVFKKVLVGIHEAVLGLHTYACLPAEGVKGGKDREGKPMRIYDETKVSAVVVLDDSMVESKLIPAWRGFLHVSNLLQFVPKALLAAESGISDHSYALIIEEEAKPSDTVSIDPKWKDIIDGLVDQLLIDIAKRLRDDGIPAPEAGLYSDEDDTPMSEFQWEDKKVLVQSEDESDYKERLQAQGWKVYGPDYEGISNALKEV